MSSILTASEGAQRMTEKMDAYALVLALLDDITCSIWRHE